MNIKSLSFAVLAISAVSLAFSQAAHAEGSEPRYRFGLNYYALDPDTGGRRHNNPAPIKSVAPATVQAGIVPHSSLIAPPASMFTKPAVVQTFAQPAQIMTAAPQIPSAFNPIFGKPATVASLPQPAQPQPAPSATAAPAKLPPIAHSSASTALRGTLLNTPHPIARSAAPAALPPAANYGTVGYQCGKFVQARSTGGSSVNTEVNGVIVDKHR